MKILIYGAGVLGSHIAHVLCSAGHDITVLARGKRLSALKQNGLVIRHYLQLRTTVDRIKVTDKLDRNDEYELVLIVMQYQQIEKILPDIAENLNTANFAFIGNNPFPERTAAYINKNSPINKNLYFGFFMAAGRIENDRVISAHTGGANSGRLMIGSLDGKSLDIFKTLCANGRLKLNIQEDIDAWLKSHAAFVLPVCYAIYQCNGNFRMASKALIHSIINAIIEGYNMLRSIGIVPRPAEDEEFVKRHRYRAYAFIKICAVTPIGRLMTSDHAMSAVEEMRALDAAFCELKEQSGITMETWSQLQKFMR